MADTRQMVLQMQQAEERGDRRSARALARQILDARKDAGASARADLAVDAGREGTADGDQAGPRRAATELLARTEPDAFLLLVGLAGLGGTVWLVYNYVL